MDKAVEHIVILVKKLREEHQIALELESKLQFMTPRCRWLEEEHAMMDAQLEQEFGLSSDPKPALIKLHVDA